MRIVLDSNLLVRAFLQPKGPANQLLLAILDRSHVLVLSSEILIETARVLRYPRVIELHGEGEGTIYDFVEWLRLVADTIPFDPFLHAPIRDVNDIFVLQTALSGRADALCTCDRDFFEPPAARFLQAHGIEVLTDVEMLRRLRA
jgi:putative PIN family toxin of toxin-antitoxin system